MAQPEFKNERFLKFFGIIGLSSFFIFTTSIYTTDLYNTVFGEEVKYKGVTIGPISRENKTDGETAKLLGKAVDDWKETAQVILQYNGKSVQVPKRVWNFRLDESVAAAISGHHPVLAEVDQERVEEALKQFKDKGLEKAVDLDLLNHELKQTASELPSGVTELKLGHYFNGQDKEPAKQSVTKWRLRYQYPLMKNWVRALDGYKIEEGAFFSLTKAMSKKGLEPRTSDDLTILSSAIYAAVAKSNFGTIERHTTLKLPQDVELGFEASVIPDEQDLIFQNPNPGSYVLNVTYEKDLLTVSFTGAPFPYEYKTKIIKRMYAPRLVVKYNKQLGPNDSKLLSAGKDGTLANVYRLSYGADGSVAEKKKLSEDFYPPVMKEEERGMPLPTPDEGEREGADPSKSSSTVDEKASSESRSSGGKEASSEKGSSSRRSSQEDTPQQGRESVR